MTDDDSVDSDEWGVEELVIPQDGQKTNIKNNGKDDENDLGDDYWKVENPVEPVQQDTEIKEEEQAEEGGEPMIIVDITQMDRNIHSKFDRNSVNQPEEASALRKKIEKNYKDYAFSNQLLAEGTIVPCGTSVWRDALVRLRDDRPGHYFVPIFAPNTK
jgi:hypothetical protein